MTIDMAIDYLKKVEPYYIPNRTRLRDKKFFRAMSYGRTAIMLMRETLQNVLDATAPWDPYQPDPLSELEALKMRIDHHACNAHNEEASYMFSTMYDTITYLLDDLYFMEEQEYEDEDEPKELVRRNYGKIK